AAGVQDVGHVAFAFGPVGGEQRAGELGYDVFRPVQVQQQRANRVAPHGPTPWVSTSQPARVFTVVRPWRPTSMSSTNTSNGRQPTRSARSGHLETDVLLKQYGRQIDPTRPWRADFDLPLRYYPDAGLRRGQPGVGRVLRERLGVGCRILPLSGT